jgi:hypothetical protein
MNKGYLVGGLAIVGAIALFAYLTPKGTKRNSDGFFNAEGTRVCVRTNPNGSTTTYNEYWGTYPCPHGGTPRNRTSVKK